MIQIEVYDNYITRVPLRVVAKRFERFSKMKTVRVGIHPHHLSSLKILLETYDPTKLPRFEQKNKMKDRFDGGREIGRFTAERD